MNTKNIVVVGSANMDLVMRVKRFPKAGETLSGKNFMTAHGGKGANQAVAAARLGARVSFVGCVGEDAFGDFQRVGFAREGMDLSYLKIHPDLPTGTAIILVADSGENTIVVDPAANNGLSPEDIARLGACFSMADQVISQLEIPLETVEATLQLARSCGTFSLLDAGPARFLPEEMVAGADLISPNESEAEALTGIRVDSRDTAREAAQRLRDWGACIWAMRNCLCPLSRSMLLTLRGLGTLSRRPLRWRGARCPFLKRCDLPMPRAPWPPRWRAPSRPCRPWRRC